jgi:hypothetical protein
VLVRIPAVVDLGAADLFLAERGAVRLLRVVLGGRPETDVGAHRDDARPIVGSSGGDRRVDGRDIVSVGHSLGVPAVSVEAAENILGESQVRRPVELDVVVVVQHHEPAQA